MSSKLFDPYCEWLGIPSEEQPPSHYRLLKINEFERDKGRIEHAYDAAMQIVKQEEHGEHLEHVEGVAKRLFQARQCLLNAESKEAYDAQLRGTPLTSQETNAEANDHEVMTRIGVDEHLKDVGSAEPLNKISSEPFDPYHKWLGIPPSEQPPHHYRLLRLSLFEADPEVIEHAYNKEMADLKLQEHGPREEYVAQLTRELVAAERCLLDVEKKKSYDAELRKKLKLEGFRTKGAELRQHLNVQDRLLALAIEPSETGAAQALDQGGSKVERYGDVQDQTVGQMSFPVQQEDNRLSKVITIDPEVGPPAGWEQDDNGLGMKLCWCPPGGFGMGDDSVAVKLTCGFWLGRHVITQEQWVQVVKTKPWSNKSWAREGAKYPATYVSWNDAMEFCRKLSEQERQAARLSDNEQYTLPTEAQWEYACRAGRTTSFSFGDDASQLGEFAWFDKNTMHVGKEYAHAQQVGLKASNSWGLYDMHGNVWEWCRDWYDSRLPGGKDPEVTSERLYRVNRGGAWGFAAGNCRVAYRHKNDPLSRNDEIGFRVACISVIYPPNFEP